MTYQAQITIAVFQKLYREKLIKLIAADPGQETGKYAKMIPKIGPFKNANFFSLLSSLPSRFSHHDIYFCLEHPDSTFLPSSPQKILQICVGVLCTEQLFLTENHHIS